MKPPKDTSPGLRHFRRAAGFLLPYWRLVVVSVVCALLVGAATAGALTSMLPIMRVLIAGDSIPHWLDRSFVSGQIGAGLLSTPDGFIVESVAPGSLADRQGLKVADKIVVRPTGFDRIVVLPDRSEVTLRGESAAWYLQWARRGAARLPAHPVGAVAVVLGCLVAVALFGNAMRFFQEYLSETAALHAIRDIRYRCFDRVLHADLLTLGKMQGSEVEGRLTFEPQTLYEGLKLVLGPTTQEPIKAAMAMGLALIVSWKLTIFLVVFGPVLFLVLQRMAKKVRRASRAALQGSTRTLGHARDTIAGLRVVRAYQAQRIERRQYRSLLEAQMRQMLKVSRTEALATPVLETLALLAVVGVLLGASWMVLIAKTLDAERFFVVMGCLISIAESLRRLGKLSTVLQRADVAGSRIFEVLDLAEQADLADRRNGAPQRRLSPIREGVTFEDVTFTYPGAATPALSEVSLAARRGQTVALVGRNGSGKTTLLSLLCRFYEPSSGRVLIDGQDIRGCSMSSLYAQIGLVTQDAVVFPISIAQNIAYGDENPDMDRVRDAARRAHADDFIQKTPLGYDSQIGLEGFSLSGGQKQRLCIARAIYRDPPILLLDEATSQVDAESEQKIQDALQALMRDRTTFVIAHRFSTILSADLIVVFDQGKIIAQGKHQELMANCTVYRQLYERQVMQ